ncbi:MAG TPA: 7TM diverse intracellular signaling domain-containing protein, partial [Chitinophagaceae bacterium]|nr:7TM diverse intracellular signaling domain-containing protein [Chitinophagaceae bacterium]
MKPLLLFLALAIAYGGQAQVVINANACTATNHIPVTAFSGVWQSVDLVPLQAARQAASEHKFVTSKNKPVVFLGYDSHFYWFQFIIRNEAPLAKDLMLVMAPVGLRDGQLFQQKEGHWKQIAKNGLRYPFPERPYQYAHYVFPFSVPAHTVDTLYLSMDASHSYKSYGFALMQPQALKIFENKVYFLFGIIVGLLLLFCLFNVYLYFTLRDKIHIWYALYIALLFLIVMKNDQLDQQFLHLDTEATYRLAPIMGLAAIAIAVLMHVIKQFLVNIKRGTFLYRLSDVIKYNVLASGVVHCLIFNLQPDYRIENIGFTWANWSTILAIVIIFFDCIYSIIKGFKSAFFMLAGLLVFLIGALQRLLLSSSLSNLFPPSVFHLGMVLETLIISFSLIYRYRMERHERNLYLKEKEDLKYSFDKLLLESKFEIQEQTLKNISQEIHDNIGQVLTLVKVNLTNIDPGQTPLLENQLTDSRELVGKAIRDLRNLSKSLNTDYVMDMGLVKSIEYELEQIKKLGGYKTALKMDGDIYRIEPQRELILFRIYQEIVNNIIKHAAASSISVVLEYQPALFVLSVSDNGKGFDVQAVMNRSEGKGMGIRNMYSRAALIGAGFDIT